MFKDYAESETKTAWEINQWFRGHNYLYVDFLMTETYNTLEQITAVMDYFLANVKLVINYLKNVDPEFKLVIYFLFSIIDHNKLHSKVIQ